MKNDILNGRYGEHPRNVYDFFFATSDNQTPLIIFIHGGGFLGGDKSNYDMLEKEYCLKNNISYATINYPLLTDTTLIEILNYITYAVRYFKYYCDDFNIDPQKVGCYGSSAGAGSSLFLATDAQLYTDDNIPFKVLKEVLSTKKDIIAAGLYQTQSTYDFYLWSEILNISADELIVMQKEHFDNSLALMYGKEINCIEDFLEDSLIPIRKKLDLINNLTKDSCPIYIKTTTAKEDTEDLLHAQVFSTDVYKQCLKLGITSELHTLETPSTHNNFIEFFIDLLKK